LCESREGIQKGDIVLILLKKSIALVPVLFVIFCLPLNIQSQDNPAPLRSGDIIFPVAVNFPVPPKLTQAPLRDIEDGKIYVYSAEDLDSGISFSTSIAHIPKKAGTIPEKTAKMMIDQTIESAIETKGTLLNRTSLITKIDTNNYFAFPSKYIETEYQEFPKVFSLYRSVFVGRHLVTLSGTGLDTLDNRSKIKTYAQSLKILTNYTNDSVLDRIPAADLEKMAKKASMMGYVSLIIAIGIPILLVLLVMNNWKPQSRLMYSLKFSFWPTVLWTFNLGTPIMNKIFGIDSKYSLNTSEAPYVIIGIFIITAPIFFGIGYWRGKKKFNPNKAVKIKP